MKWKDSYRVVFLLFTVSFLLFSCDGLSNSNNDITNGYSGVNLMIQGSIPSAGSSGRASASSTNLSVSDVTGNEIGVLTLTDARVNIYQIEMEQDIDEIDSSEEEAQALEIEYTGPFVADLLKDIVTPDLPVIELLPGTYDKIKLKVASIEGDELDDEGNPLILPSDPLYGNSIVLIGSYTGAISGASVTDMTFTATFSVDEEFELSGSEGFILDEGVVNPIIIAYRMARWFQFENSETNSNSVDFNTLTSSGGELNLSDTENADLWEVVKKNIKNSADFGKDSDDDGELESDEDEDDSTEDSDDF